MIDFTINEDFPDCEIEFDQRFNTPDACYEYLAQTKWPKGFICESCGHSAYWISSKHIYICRKCDHQYSLTADTILNRTRKPITLYTLKTHWEIGRAHLQAALDCSAFSLETFINLNIEDSSTVVTDNFISYPSILNQRYCHITVDSQDKKDPEKGLHGALLIVSLVKPLIRGTFQGRFEPKYLQNYLDEYVFRFNRRKSKSIGKKFMRIVQQVMKSCKIRNKDIQFDLDPISEYFSLGLSA